MTRVRIYLSPRVKYLTNRTTLRSAVAPQGYFSERKGRTQAWSDQNRTVSIIHSLPRRAKKRISCGSQNNLCPSNLELRFNFDVPAGLNEPKLPIISRKILINGNNGEQLSVPYFGTLLICLYYDVHVYVARRSFADQELLAFYSRVTGNVVKDQMSEMFWTANRYPALTSTNDAIPSRINLGSSSFISQ